MVEPKYNEGRQRPIRVLLAEDDDAMREFLASVLSQDGYDVIEISDGSELSTFFTDIHLATQDARLDCCADGHHFVRVDALVRVLTC